MQNLGGRFVVFFRGPKSQLCESQGVKTAIKPITFSHYRNER